MTQPRSFLHPSSGGKGSGGGGGWVGGETHGVSEQLCQRQHSLHKAALQSGGVRWLIFLSGLSRPCISQ